MKNLYLTLLVFSSYLALGQTEEPIYSATEVDTAAIFIGGEEAIYAFINENVRPFGYRGEDSIVNVRVFTSFVVEKDGTLSNRKIVRGSHQFWNEEAMRLLLTLPNNWYPALKDGKPVRYQYNLPIRFQFTFTTDQGGGRDTIWLNEPLNIVRGDAMERERLRLMANHMIMNREEEKYDATQTNEYSYAIALMEKGEYQKAYYEIAWLYRSDPKNPELLLQLGIVSLKLGKTKSACSNFRAAKDYGHPKADEWIQNNCK